MNINPTLIILIIASVIIGFFVSSAILYGITKLFKITGATYKRSLLVTLGTIIGGLIASVIFGIVNLGLISNLLVTIATFIVFHFLLKKFYQNGWGKSLGIYVTNGIITAILGLAIVLPIRFFVFEPFVAAGQSMSPHINQGDYLFIEKFVTQYKRDDVIVMRLPNTDQYLIKRVVGLPTEKIEISNGQILISGSIFNDSYITTPIQGSSSVTLAADEYYVLGDNPSVSQDSRIFGPVRSVDIVGKVAGH